jgi:uncharacterized protein (TIGR02231 family)
MDAELTTTIAEVTVYPERALVRRHGTLAIAEAGEHALRIGGLPQSVQRDSLRASGRGPAGTRILGIEQVAEFYPAAPEEALQRLRDEITRLEREVELLNERERSLDDQRNWLRALGEQTARRLASGIAGGTAKPADASAVFAYTDDEAQRLAAARLDLRRRRDELVLELGARRREYAELGGMQRPDRLAALVRIEVASPGEVAIDLSYLVSGSSWLPRYDARVDVPSARVHLTQQALVTQRTGEDWADVALALSTARPSAAATLPDEPAPWYIDVRKPMPPRPQMMARMIGPLASGAAMPQAAYSTAAPAFADDTTPGAYAVEAEMAVSEVERSGAAQVFRMPGGTDVPSDGRPHTLGLAENDLPCRFEYVAIPAVAPGAHLRALAANRTGRVLLAGELHVFHAGAAGDEYVGATNLDLTAQDAELKLYLGVDDNVTVKSELVERDTDKGSLLQGGVRRVTVGYRATVANRTGAPQRLLLLDRLPVPRHEKVKVRLLDVRPQPTARTRLDQLTWELQLAPNEERRVEWRFVVESPGDLDLTGLP